MPLVIIAALAIAAVTGVGKPPGNTDNPTSGVLPALSPTAPPHAGQQAAACAKVLEQLPVSLGKLQPRVVHTRPDSPYVVAWGNPAVVLSCGVDRPPDLKPGSATDFVTGGVETGPFYDVTRSGSANVFTTVDRQPYISILVPGNYEGSAVLPPLSRAIAQALPAVCSTDSSIPDPDKLCTRRPS